MIRRIKNETLESIALDYGLSRERVRQIENKNKNNFFTKISDAKYIMDEIRDYLVKNKFSSNGYYSIRDFYSSLFSFEGLYSDDNNYKESKFINFFEGTFLELARSHSIL